MDNEDVSSMILAEVFYALCAVVYRPGAHHWCTVLDVFHHLENEGKRIDDALVQRTLERLQRLNLVSCRPRENDYPARWQPSGLWEPSLE